MGEEHCQVAWDYYHQHAAEIDAGIAKQRFDDSVVLADAIMDQRAVLTYNHADCKRLHRQGSRLIRIVKVKVRRKP